MFQLPCFAERLKKIAASFTHTHTFSYALPCKEKGGTCGSAVRCQRRRLQCGSAVTVSCSFIMFFSYSLCFKEKGGAIGSGPPASQTLGAARAGQGPTVSRKRGQSFPPLLEGEKAVQCSYSLLVHLLAIGNMCRS